MIEDLKPHSDTLLPPLREVDISRQILTVRGHRVIIDADLAEIYGVPTKALNQAVKRNSNRFPVDFAFRLTAEEKAELVTICDRFNRLKHSAATPLAFTEHGVIMAANVMNSPRAIEGSVQVVRAFVKMRQVMASHRGLAHRLSTLESKYDAQFSVDAIAFLTGMRPNEMIALKWTNVDFEMRCITDREGRVLGIEGPPKTMSSHRNIDMLDPLFEALRKHRQEARPGTMHVFPGKTGRKVANPTLKQLSKLAGAVGKKLIIDMV